MDHRDKLLGIVKEKGPLFPAQINKEMKTNVLFASAMLSEMVDQKKLKLTAMKVGGSPLYYCEGQENLLERFAVKLNESELSAFEILKKEKVVRDRSQTPQIRVALREIRDFAVPLEVSANGNSDLFWKYYLVPDEEAKRFIGEQLEKNEKAAQEVQRRQRCEKPKEVQSTIDSTASQSHFKRGGDLKSSPVRMNASDDSDVSEFSYQPTVSFSTLIDTESAVKLEKKGAGKQEPVVFPDNDDFFNKIKSFFDSSAISINDFNLVRKGSEYDFLITLPSNVGSLNYYCKAKSKAKINEGDLSTAFVFGQMKNLPILFITMGDLTKRGQDILSREFRNMVVKKI